jgi:hypothetical protein
MYGATLGEFRFRLNFSMIDLRGVTYRSAKLVALQR